jgi:hypothetical protein
MSAASTKLFRYGSFEKAKQSSRLGESYPSGKSFGKFYAVPQKRIISFPASPGSSSIGA